MTPEEPGIAPIVPVPITATICTDVGVGVGG
jgi:hypothetical protein